MPVPRNFRELSVRLTNKAFFAGTTHKELTSELLAVLVIYALCLQLVTPSVTARVSSEHKITEAEQIAVNSSARSLTKEADSPTQPVEIPAATVTDAVVSRHKPILNGGRIEGTLRVLLGESFTISSTNQITSDLYLPGTPTIQLSGNSKYAGVVNDGGVSSGSNYTVSLSGDVDLPGHIHTNTNPIELPNNFPASIPVASGVRTISIHSQSETSSIGDWQTVSDLSVTGNGLTVNIPPGNYGTFTVNGNSRLNFTAGTYNFANSFNLDGSASIQATGVVVINVAKNLTVTSGALVLGSYTSPGDVHLNVLGTAVNVNGSSQISGLLRADNANATITGAAQVRGQVIANSITLNGGKVIGSVWPAHSGSTITTFGPRRFDRTTGPPNQYLEQFSLPPGTTPPYTLHIKNGSLAGTNRVSSATVKLNGAVILSPTDLNQNIPGVDRAVTLDAANTLAVSLASLPGSYLIIDISGSFSPGDSTPPVVTINSPVNNSTTTDSQIIVSGTASDPGNGTSGLAHVMVNGQEASYNLTDQTWTIAGVALTIGANSIVAQAIDQAGNQTTINIAVTRETPNQPPLVNAGPDQTFALPETATLHGLATDDGLPQSVSLLTSWSLAAGPGTVTFADPNALNTNAIFSLAGTYVLRLTADDGVLSSSDDLTIAILPQNQPPTVVAGPDQIIALPHEVTLNGSATDDGIPASSILEVGWSQISGPGTATFAESYLADTSVSFSVPGNYVLRLTASDSELSSASELTVTVHPENHAPAASAGPDQIIALPACAILNGLETDDGWPAGSNLSATWSVVSGPGSVNIENENVTATPVSFGIAGTYVLRLTVSDGELSTSDDVIIIVDPLNQPPLVNAGPDQTVTLDAGLNLDAVVSDDGWPRNSTLTFRWSQISGQGPVSFTNPVALTTTAIFSQAGSYVLRMTASDSQVSAVDDATITVTAPRVAPVADFVVPESTGTAGSFVISSSGFTSANFSADKILDNNASTFWTTPGVINQFAKLQFFDQESVFIDRVRLQPANGTASPTSVREFDIQVSATSSDDANFVTVLSTTLLNNGELQEFMLPDGPARARFIKFVARNNYGSTNNIQLGTFNAVAVGGADSIISLPEQTNAALTQSPGLIANGATIYNSSDRFGSLPPNGLLGYNNGGWAPLVSTNPFAIIQLAGGKLYTVNGIKLATGWNNGFGQPSAVKNFEIWVSATTPDDASFTKVLTATASFSATLQPFTFPGGPAAVRYVKYVPLTNNGGSTVVTQALDVIAAGVGQIVSASSQSEDNLNPAEAAFDNDASSIWYSKNTITTNVWVKTALADGLTQKLFGVRINPVNDSSNGQHGPKDFDIRVSTTSTDDNAFTTVYSGTLANTLNGGAQEFLFPNFVDARYVQFFWKNSYSTAHIGVRTLEALAAPTRGASLIAFSSQEEPASNALDLDPANQWVTALNNPTNQWLKLLLPKADIQTIRHIALRPAISANGNYSAPKDFELQVSTTDAVDSSFSTVLTGALVNSSQLQDFYFSPALARYVRLLLKNNYGGGRFGLASFYVYSSDQIGTTTRFIDRSSDVDGQVVSWAWNFGDGGASTEQHPLHAYALPGDYTVRLTVADNSGLTNTHQTVYHVADSLAVSFAASPQIAHEGGDLVRFTDLTKLLLGPTALRNYDFGDGSSSSQTSNTALHTFTESGTYHVALKVSDLLGISYVANKDVLVLNVAPLVDIPNGKTVVWGEPWTSVPTITDQSLIDRLTLQGKWNFGDGQTAECLNCTNANATVTHAFGAPGTYAATLAITDRDGGVGSDTATYIVTKRSTSLTFLANVPQPSGQTFISRVKLTDLFAGAGIPNRSIQFNLNVTTGSAITDAGGIAEINLPVTANENVAVMTASWTGDGLYLTSNNTATTTLNFAPTVYAGADQALTLPCAVNLNATVSDDGVPAGVPLSISWSKLSGPGNASFTNGSAAQTTATFSASGKYVLRLTASDTRLTSSDDVIITVNVPEPGASQYFSPTPYLSFADSPLSGRNPIYFYLENFEDHLLNTPGVTASAGGVTSVVFGTTLHDSVDGDDGAIDGSGSTGDSYINTNGAAGIRFTFNPAVLGSLPTHTGLVWTDGAGQIFFEAFDNNGISLGLQGPFNFADGVNNGTTAEDRFLGAYNKDGISAIRVFNSLGGIEIDHLQYGFSTGNLAPLVNAGSDQNIFLPATTLNLNGAVSDDGLPPCSPLTVSWSLLSGPGAVNFTNAQAAQTTATLMIVGQYTLRLTASDGQYTASDDVIINLWPPNQAPAVNAGADLSITLPAAADLQGAATDDGLPANSLTVSWAKVSGPGSVSFGNSNAASTSAIFSAAGVYILSLIATDTALSSTDEVQVTVNAPPINHAPTADAGPDQVVALNANLIANGGSEEPSIDDEIPGWSEFQGTSWTSASAASINEFPDAQRGSSYFYAGKASQAELRQDIDLSSYAAGIANGTQQFEFKAYLRSVAEPLPDNGRVVLEYRDATNTAVIATLDSGEITSTSGWQLTEDTRVAPAGSGWVRVRLIATRNPNAASDAGNDAFFDSVSLRPPGAAAVKLGGVVNDDGLPSGSTLNASWTMVSGPAPVRFTTANAAVSGVSFTTAGTYVLRLSANDGQSNTSDDVTIVVTPPNQPPLLAAGVMQTIILPAHANLSPSLSDDGYPAGSSLSVLWRKVSGPGVVMFANSNQANTTASFGAPGLYVLQLTADDSEYAVADAVTIAVSPGSSQVNQPPVVSAGTNQTISLPINTVTLNGIATDDGLPAGSTLTVSWAAVSGPGIVIFSNANGAISNAQFSAPGIYVLRLTVADGAYTVGADVSVIVAPQNFPPTADAGPDQTVLLSQVAQLSGTAGDDGLPAGSSLTTDWTKVSGSGDVTFLNSNVMVTGAWFSATGTYVLRLSASDGTFSTTDDIKITVIDNVAPPTVVITAPTDGASVTEPTLVTGSVSGGDWRLEYSLASDDDANNRVWTTFASGSGVVTNAALGTLDPTMMLNGLFDIRLSATDGYGQTSRTTIAVIVERNLKIGNFTISFSDLNIPVAGLPLEVTRTYDSRDEHVGDFGVGWTLGLHNIRLQKSGALGFKWYESVSQELIPNYCLEATGTHLVTVSFPGGKVFKFQATVNPHCQRFAPVTSGTLTFTPLPGTHGTLEIFGAADFQVAGSVPGPVNLVGFGSGVDIFNSSLFRFTAEDGTAFVIDQRAGLQSLTDTNNNTVTVSAGGLVHSNSGSDTNSISFTRDALGRITSVIDPNGNAQTYTYDTAGDLVAYTDNENNTSTYAYDEGHRLLTIHDPRGIEPIRNDYDGAGRLIGHTDGSGKVITYVHDLPGRTETITDRLGRPSIFQYDNRGNVLSKNDARGGVTTFTYDLNDNVITETNALGKTTTYTYDAEDHRTSVTDPLSHTTRFTYNALGKLLTTTDALGHVTTNTYNAAGSLLTTTDALNNTTSFGYSLFDGQRTSMTGPLGNTTSYAYTGGYLTKEMDALGHETTFTYDANGNRASQSVKRTNAQGQLETITTSYEYDRLNRLTKTTSADGSTTQVEYNLIGQRAATIDQLGHRIEFTYDEMGRLIRTTYPDANHEDTAFDAEGQRLTSTDRAGRVTSFTYDELGHLTRTTYADGAFTSSSYDAAGQVLSTTDARGNVTHYEYDDAGRRTKVRNALSQETSFTYDANGNQVSVTDALGHTTGYEYDLNNRRIKTSYADGSFDTTNYDALGRSASRTDQAGKTTEFIYDALGQLTKVRDALNHETIYGYNELGQQISQTDANNHTTRFSYDQLGRRVKRTLPEGQFESYCYDNSGSLQSRTDFNGKTTTFTYDLMRRLLSKVPDASLNQAPVSFTYNATGQRATMNDVSGTTLYNYDVRGRLGSKQTPFGALSYTYDSAGNLLTTRSANTNGVSVDYSYDSLNRLANVRDNNLAMLNDGLTIYSYDPAGNLKTYLYPNGLTTTYNFNSLNRLTSMNVSIGSSTVARYSYVLGATGNRTAVTELSGRTANYTYDDLYRLTNESITNDSHAVNGTLGYSYDPVGNRLDLSSTVPAVASQTSGYDADDRLASDGYDNNGNTTASKGSNYTYDFDNRLTSLNSGSVTYVYDGDGNRVGKTVNGVTTNYLVDSNNPTGYAQVVEELRNGAVTKSFTYGHDLISQRIVGNTVSFYGYDGHGSVRLLTDAATAITDTYDYDAFGNLISRTGTTSNDYLYSGEQFDADLGFYYLRARYVNTSSGRFMSSDSFGGHQADPPSLHKYLYANSDPVDRVDPSGQFSLASTVINSSIIGAISGFGLGLLTGGLKGAVQGAIQGAVFGALIPLTGAGVGVAMLGNAARGVFIVGLGVSLGSAGVSGYSFGTATTGEERFEAGVGLVASVGFMFVGPKVLQYANTRTIAAQELNAEFLTLRNGQGQPPWMWNASVTETTIFRSAKYVRVFTEGQTKPVGAWVMEASEIEGLSMSQIAQKFALPFTPTNITAVDLQAGTTIRIGLAGQNDFGPGGGMQVHIQQ